MRKTFQLVHLFHLRGAITIYITSALDIASDLF